MNFICSNLEIRDGEKILVNNISFEIEDSFALVGESGSGKSLTLKAILNMLPSNLRVKFDYKSDFELKRGENISIVVQNPFTALSPLTKIKKQFLKPIDEVKEYLKLVELDESFLDRYPPELSGGQLQRVVIAMALSIKPKLLLLDEPTTALDYGTKITILNLIKSLQKERNFKILFVTHDIEASIKLCNEIAIIRKGLIVEKGLMEEIIKNPKEEYTKRLINANFKNRRFRE